MGGSRSHIDGATQISDIREKLDVLQKSTGTLYPKDVAFYK